MSIYYQHIGERMWERDAPRSIGTSQDGVKRFTWGEIDAHLELVTPFEKIEARAKAVELAPTGFQIWGIPSGAQQVLKDMGTGDFLMLLESTEFRYVGQVIHRFHQPNYSLSRHIWEEERFPLIIILQGELVTYGWTDFVTEFKFAPKYHMRGNTMRLADSKIVDSNYGTEENFVSKVLTTTGLRYGDQEIDFKAFANNLEVHLRQLKTRRMQQAFRLAVLNKQGRRCALCNIEYPEVLEAAHIIPKENDGTDDCRNGLVLCALHHRMFDTQMFGVNPLSLAVELAPGYTFEGLRIVRRDISHLQSQPDSQALDWRWRNKPLFQSDH